MNKNLHSTKKVATFATLLESTDSLAQLVEHNTFNVGVLGSSPSGITERQPIIDRLSAAFVFTLSYRNLQPKKSGIFLFPILIHFYKVCILFKTTVKMQFRVIPRYFYCSATPSIVNIYSNKI